MKEIAIADTLRSLLAQNIVFFTFRKVNGEIRHARGTRNILAAENYTSQHISRPMGEEQPNSYYDVEKMGWRSYKPENIISIDGVLPRMDTEFAKKPTLPNEPPKQAKKPELPKREIPVKMQPVDLGGLGGLLGGFKNGFGDLGKEIRKAMDDLNEDITFENPPYTKETTKVGKPVPTTKGMALPINTADGKDISIDDFAKLVAKYVVAELVARLTR